MTDSAFANATADKRPASFVEPLFFGEIHEDLVFPYPRPSPAERDKVESLTDAARSFLAAHFDARRVEDERWIGDEIVAGLAERGLLGLNVPEKYGGQGLSQTGYCRVFETFSSIDPTIAIVLGAHQSLGIRAITRFGTEEQQARLLPDLAAGRKLAGFAITEPEAGSDAFHVRSRAVRESDGHWRLDGEKRWIGNGSKDIIVVLARTDDDHHNLLIVEKGMAGFDVGPPYETMGLKGNDLRPLYFRGVRVPPENVLGEPGEGYRLAMEVLHDGRLTLAAGCVGSARRLLDLAVPHVTTRRQFDRRLGDFELVAMKVGSMVSYLYGLEAMVYLTTSLADAGLHDYSLEAAIVKVTGSEFVWYAANRAFQLAGGLAYMVDQPYEKILRDTRVFSIFEGANDVLRVYISLSGLKGLGEELEDLKSLDLREPIRSLGVLAEYAGERIRREIRPDRLTRAHQDLAKLADPIADQVKRLRNVGERLLRQHRDKIAEQQGQLKRLTNTVSDIYGQIAVLSRVSDVIASEHTPDAGEERTIAESFVSRAASRVDRWLHQIEANDDDRMHAIARRAYQRGSYGHSL